MITHTTLAAELTKATGDTWVGGVYDVDPDKNFKVTREKDGMSLQVNRGNGTAWNVSLNLWVNKEFEGNRLPAVYSAEQKAATPWGKVDGKYAGGGINISASKSAEQAAWEIVRRSLPMVDPAWAHITASLAETAAYHNAAGTLADDLAALVGAKATHDRGDHKIDPKAVTRKGYGSIEVYRDSVNLKLSGLTPDEARAVIKALAALK